ncbi:hypothetical protein LTR08_004311 [Meristemomyces frigidus]|nr:hypothetical protein LTR08_004311 [Meristemomyces frigidus]
MGPFTLPLADGNRITGLLCFPPKPTQPPKGIPLVVTVHGGTYTASYYDADAVHTISNPAKALSIPVVALTRPGYGDSTALPPLREGETWNKQTGTYIHEQILPAIWKAYGARTGASSIVLHSHSIGASIAIVTTALHNRSPDTASYPLSGLVTSGIGAKLADEPAEHDASHADKNASLSQIDTYEPRPGEDAPMMTWPVEAKDAMMLCSQTGLCDPELLKGTTAKLNHPSSILEPVDIRRQWPKYWHGYAADITVPHMYAVGSEDALWMTEKKWVDAYAAAFSRSARMEAAALPFAPHCIELSHLGQSWLARTLGFAGECAVWDVLRKEKEAGGE